MNRTNVWLAIGSAVAALATNLAFPLSLHADEILDFKPDHYLSYEIKAATLRSHKIKLRDQFIDWTDFVVSKPTQLLNPVLKRHNGTVSEIINKQLHYTAYKLEKIQHINVSKRVAVRNQFGDFILDKFRPHSLLTPSLKKNYTPFDADAEFLPEAQVPLADHYLCYEIPPFTVTTESGFLKDQFRSRIFGTLTARKFCNPVAKIHKNKVYEIINDVQSNHLMCFELDKKRIFRIVKLLNQFGSKTALVVKDNELCVPSVKTELPTECTGSSPNEEGICNGYCPDSSDMCLVDPTTQRCACVPKEPVLCGDSAPDAAGQCNGLCPTGSTCVVNADQKCACRQEIPACSLTPDGQCGGPCANDTERCTFLPGTNECACIPQG